MLVSVCIKNFLLIDYIIVDSFFGFNVITGETGSGKSILLNALRFVVGKFNGKNCLRSGTESGFVCVEFIVNDIVEDVMELYNIPKLPDKKLIIRRMLSKNKSPVSYVNDIQIVNKLLSEIGMHLIEFHCQNDQVSIFDTSNYIDILDMYGKLSLSYVIQSYDDWVIAKHKLDELLKKITSVKEEKEYSRYAYDELKKSDIYIGEEEKLVNQRQKLITESKMQEYAKKIFIIFRGRCFCSTSNWKSTENSWSHKISR